MGDEPNSQRNAIKRKTCVHTPNPTLEVDVYFFEFNSSDFSSKLCCGNSNVTIFFSNILSEQGVGGREGMIRKGTILVSK
jgi:hypothetical protein